MHEDPKVPIRHRRAIASDFKLRTGMAGHRAHGVRPTARCWQVEDAWTISRSPQLGRPLEHTIAVTDRPDVLTDRPRTWVYRSVYSKNRGNLNPCFADFRIAIDILPR